MIEPGTYAVVSFSQHVKIFNQLSEAQNIKLFEHAGLLIDKIVWVKVATWRLHVRPSELLNQVSEWVLMGQMPLQYMAESIAIYENGELLELRKSRLMPPRNTPAEIHSIDYPIINPPFRNQLDISSLYEGDAGIKSMLQEAFDLRLLNSVLQYSMLE